jgi:hypothetical protein
VFTGSQSLTDIDGNQRIFNLAKKVCSGFQEVRSLMVLSSRLGIGTD